MRLFKLGVICVLSTLACSTLAAAETVSIECGSSYDTERMNCELPENAIQVALERLISHQSCQFGKNWGLEENILWTENGCEASFTIFYGTQENDGDTPPLIEEEGVYTVDA